MNAPLPAPSKTTASGNTQHKDATNAEARLTIPDFMFKICILFILNIALTFLYENNQD